MREEWAVSFFNRTFGDPNDSDIRWLLAVALAGVLSMEDREQREIALEGLIGVATRLGERGFVLGQLAEVKIA